MMNAKMMMTVKAGEFKGFVSEMKSRSNVKHIAYPPDVNVKI